MPQFKGSHRPDPQVLEKFDQMVKTLKLNSLKRKALWYRSILDRPKPIEKLLAREGKRLSEALASTFQDFDCPHPLFWVLSDIQEAFELLEADITEMDNAEEMEEALADIEFIPIP